MTGKSRALLDAGKNFELLVNDIAIPDDVRCHVFTTSGKELFSPKENASLELTTGPNGQVLLHGETTGICDGVQLKLTTDCFIAADDPDLFVIREIIYPSADCDFSFVSGFSAPADNSDWKLDHSTALKKYVTGLYLKSSNSDTALHICEATQLRSCSMKVNEERELCLHKYQITAFEDNPITIEKFIYLDVEAQENIDEDHGLLKCMSASTNGFVYYYKNNGDHK